MATLYKWACSECGGTDIEVETTQTVAVVLDSRGVMSGFEPTMDGRGYTGNSSAECKGCGNAGIVSNFRTLYAPGGD